MTETSDVRVQISPRQLRLAVPVGTPLLDVLAENQLVSGPCGGLGLCGRCRVRWLSPPPHPTSKETARLTRAEIDDGWRLACQHRLATDASIWVAPPVASVDWKSCGRTSLESGPRVVERRVLPSFAPSDPPALSWTERLSASVGMELHWSPRTIAESATAHWDDRLDGIVLYTSGREILHLCAAEASCVPHGIAVDIGTSVIGLYLVDLEAAEVTASESVLNPQAAYGADVLSRIAYVQNHGKPARELLTRLVRQELDSAIGRLVDSAGVDRQAVFHVRAVGNPTMLHLFFGVDPRVLGQAPFTPMFRGVVSCPAAGVGLEIAEGAQVDSLPGVSGFVGSDAVAGALSAHLGDPEETALLMDVGTNAELMLAHQGEVFACSAAAGPALELSAFRHGAGLEFSATSKPEIDAESPGVFPCGQGNYMRGSTLLELLAELLDSGAVSEDGRIDDRDPSRPASSRESLTSPQSETAIRGRSLLSQRDIRQIQLAIAALRSGIEQLLAAAHVQTDEISRVVVSGSFGVRLDPRTMVRVGLLPPELGMRVQALENAAGLGATRTLVDERLTDKAVALAAAAHSVPLGGSGEYVKRFVRAMAFPPRARGRGKELE